MADLTLRSVKGAPLTNNEVDGNFTSLNTAKYESGDSPTFADIIGDTLQFTGGSGTQGTLSWNSDEETVDLIQDGATLQIGQEVQYHVRNNSGSTITDGTPVMATGTIGNSSRITISPMDGTDIANAKYFLGVATEDIANNTDGKVTFFGKVRSIDTSAYSDGDVLWVSTTTAGAFTATEPTSGIRIPAAYVIHSHSNGSIFVRATSGHALHESHDVSITSVTTNDYLKYDGSNWVNTSVGNFSSVTTTGDVSVGGDLTVTGNATIDGRDIATDGAKLDGIEAGATADQTPSEILTAVKTVDGTGSGLDADLLDGQHGSYYTGYTDTAIANLADSAPATLDTLNELAAALGDDANFSTTVTNSIALKSPIASPTFTGTVTIPTVDINAGAIDGTAIGAASASTGAFTTLNATGGGSLTGTWSDLGTVTTVDINGGTVDGVIIGGSSAAAGSFTTLSASGTITGNVTGNLTGNADTATTAGTVTTAAQPNITSLGTLTELTVDNLTFNGAAITSDTGAISFDNENLTTTGTLSSGALTVTGTGSFAAGSISMGSGYGLLSTVTNGTVSIAAGTNTNVGANWLLYGSTHANANDAAFRASASTELYYDDSASSWDFQANNITTTGTASTGALTVSTNGNDTLGISVDNSSGGTAARATINIECDGAAGGVFATSSAYTTVPSWQDALVMSNSSLHSGGTIINAQSGGVKLQTSLTDRYVIDASGNHDFQAGNITTTGTLDSGALTVAGDLTLSEGKVSITDTANEAALAITTSVSTNNGAFIQANSVSTGRAWYVFSDFANGGTRTLAEYSNINTGATGATCLTLSQAAAQRALYVDQNGNSRGVYIDSAATTSDGALFVQADSLTTGNVAKFYSNSTSTATRNVFEVNNANALSTATTVVKINQASTNQAVAVTAATTSNEIMRITGDSLTTGTGLTVYSNSADTGTRSLVSINNDHASSSGATALRVKQDAAQRALYIDQNGSAPAIEVDGGGIKFTNATASSDVNTLDDYEEGAHQATMTPNTSGTITLNSLYDTLSYTKIGRVVTVTGMIEPSSVSSPVGTYVDITLPFAIGNLTELGGRVGTVITATVGGSASQLALQGAEGASVMRVYVDASTIGTGSTNQFYFGFSYHTS